MKWTTGLLLAVVCLTPSLAAAAEKYALLIGVAKYEHAEMNKPEALQYPEADAKALGELLKSGGYKIDLLLGSAATQTAIQEKLKALTGKAEADGVVLIGLFGHGVEVNTVDSEGRSVNDACFCPYDTSMREALDFKGQPVADDKKAILIEPAPDGLIKLGELMRALKVAKAGHRIVLADCCRTIPNAPRGRSFGANFKVQDLPDNTSLLFGCSPNEQAFEHDDWGHGAFTKCLLESIGELSAEGPVDTAQLASQMKKRVPVLVAGVSPRDRQTPKPFITDVVDLQLELTKAITAPKEIRNSNKMRLNPKVSANNPALMTNSIGMRLKLIPAGEFLMGSDASLNNLEADRFILHDGFDNSDESPAHRVRITKPFYMGIHEVTRGQFAEFVNDTGYQTDAEKDGKGGWGIDAATGGGQKAEYNWQVNGFPQRDNHPVINVSWNDAIEFIKWLNKREDRQYRLPTEAEWEYCCRAGIQTHFSAGHSLGSMQGFGNVLDQSYKSEYSAEFADGKSLQAFSFNDGFIHSSLVGLLKPNGFGLYDMHGNVWEWCSDWYSNDFYATSLQGNPPVSVPLTDPEGPDTGSKRVCRGGSWSSTAVGCRSAFRNQNDPSYRDFGLGFRVALSPSDL